VVALDNLSWLPQWLSDSLSTLATGGGFTTRELYTDDEEAFFNNIRPVVLTGIEVVATKSDLLDRSLLLELRPIPNANRRPEAALWSEFNQARPAILGSLLDAAASGLRHLATTRVPNLERMADFCEWVSACEPGWPGVYQKPGNEGLPWPPGEFMKAYRRNRGDANDHAITSEPIGETVLQLAQAGTWQGTASELLKKLTAMVGEARAKANGWPKSVQGLTGQLTRVSPNLRRAGFEVTNWREPGDKRTRMTRIGPPGEDPRGEQVGEPSSPTSLSSRPPANPGKNEGPGRGPPSRCGTRWTRVCVLLLPRPPRGGRCVRYEVPTLQRAHRGEGYGAAGRLLLAEVQAGRLPEEAPAPTRLSGRHGLLPV
jgi:hypothetical protein